MPKRLWWIELLIVSRLLDKFRYRVVEKLTSSEISLWTKTKLHFWTFAAPFNRVQRVVGDGEEVNVHANQVVNLQFCDVCVRDLEVGQVLWDDILWDGGDIEALTMHEQGVASYVGAGGEVVGLMEGN